MTDGWSEPWPLHRSDDDAWGNFLAQLDPKSVEAERYRVPDADERPGSLADLRMKSAHAYLAADYWARVRAGYPLPLTDAEWRTRRAFQYADADAEIAARGFDTPEDITAAIRSYVQKRAASAAERRAAA